MGNLIKWLLEGPPWIQYMTRTDLMNQSEDDPAVIETRKAFLEDSHIRGLLRDVSDWPGYELKNHKDSFHPIHKLAFLADIGIKSSDINIKIVIDKIFKHKSEEGLFQTFINAPKKFGGNDEGMWTWMLCDAPLIIYSLIKFGLEDNKDINEAIKYLSGLISENGWRCIVSKDLKFRGPGKKEDPCPYATLLMLKILALLDQQKNRKEINTGAEVLLSLWEKSIIYHPYIFYMGNDFRKLKAPMVWYDLLHLLYVLTSFPTLLNDLRLKEMIDILRSKADKNGRFTPESIYTKLSGWEFSQKREPSRFLTLIANKILLRVK